MSEDDLKGKIDVNLWSVNLRKGSMNLGAKLTRIPTWLRRTVEMAMERDNVEEDEEEEEEVNVDIDEDTERLGVVSGDLLTERYSGPLSCEQILHRQALLAQTN